MKKKYFVLGIIVLAFVSSNYIFLEDKNLKENKEYKEINHIVIEGSFPIISEIPESEIIPFTAPIPEVILIQDGEIEEIKEAKVNQKQVSVLSKKPTDKELEELKNKGLISEDEFLIYSGNEISVDRIHLYSMYINGEKKSESYSLFLEDEKIYFPLISFFQLINFKNYEQNNDILIGKLGDRLDEIVIDIKNNRILKNNDEIKLDEGDIKKQAEEIYLEKDVFRKLFLTNLALSKEKEKVNMTLNFATPEEIGIRQNNNERLLKEDKEVNDLLFTNEKKLFELGYLRTELNQIFKKSEYEKNGDWQSDWEANLEYQGALLYGEITANYDVKNHIFEDVKLRYDNLYKEHTFEVGSYKYMDGGAREWELSLKKDKGYIVTGSKNYIIKENVPLGSRVELLYLGVIIDIENSQNGVIEFKNDEIKEDREYELKIYTPDGKILTRIINTTSNYNQQNKGEVEYDVNIRENHEIEKPTIDSKVYYGLTDNLTVGVGYLRDPELINDNYEYLDKGRIEAVYSDYIYSMPYTIRAGGDKVFNEFEYKVNEKNTKDDYSYDLLGQIDINKVRLRLEHESKGEFYEDKYRSKFYMRYTPIKSLDLEYEHERNTKRDGIYGIDYKEKLNKYSIEYSKSYKDLLITGEYEYETDNKGKYSLNTYYTGLRTMTMKLENTLLNEGKDYEVAFSIFSNGNQMFDYNLEARYSEEDKDKFTFRFSTNYNNWLDYDMFMDKKGNQEHKFGIDKITDLRNIKASIKNMESSPLKVITFIDKNDNDKFEEGEEVIKGVEVEIGDQKILTDKNGEAMFYGVPNQVIYELEPKIKKPNFLLGNNKVQVQGKNTSTIVAHIPVKPMLTLTGFINIDDILDLSSMDKIRLYDELLITVKDSNGKVIDRAIPDEQGIFEISGLLPKNYLIEVTYMGIDHQIQGINDEIVKLTYVEQKESNRYVFNIKNHGITMVKGENRI
ncbi:carboxypeptidase regulatory-like domain-containing protein [Cetobacterium sp. 2A]|uniref:carboxypeptidase regulatory-like domain-containing protein n=1 Tax=Cetobacterium sp. 2A TaxID=2754723 RepID=UPI00163C198E|nr:carboxypeptidase regulatory-like domain-containing protein [Cetobacterium sp. 2A]MBC2857010.1 carboxypeptidase regulatory-like domain-containing protein [Cetobacterium sp. 2A]